MNKLTSLMLVLCFVLPTHAFSQPIRENTDWEISDDQISGWQPVEMPVYIGNNQIKVWILRPTVPSPISGYLLEKPDFVEIKRVLDNLEQEINRIKSKERKHCDVLLSEKDNVCKKLNSDLIGQIDIQKIDILNKKNKINSLNRENFWTKIVSGTIVLGLSLFSIYAVSK